MTKCLKDGIIKTVKGDKNMTNQEIYNAIESKKTRSAWDKGVKEYALELMEVAIDENWTADEKHLLNGAQSWREFSWGGCSLIYNQDIAERLCTKTELKKTKNGQRRPNSREEWLDTQARALYQANLLIQEIRERG